MNNQVPTTNIGDEERAKTVRTIWHSTVVAFVMSIPLVAVSAAFCGAKAIMIPIAIAASSAISTIAVWSIGRPRSARPAAALEEKIKELDQRLGNLELIESTALKLANRSRPCDQETRVAGVEPSIRHGVQSSGG